ncbi:MAG: hypothetical protein ISS23_03500 [Nanoarchaeota archaeon]|nr:hypothetical protein [Nanoarchaeota archaeon]
MANEQQGKDLNFVLNDLNVRIRVLENRYSLFGERLLVVNQNMIEEHKKLMRKNKSLDDELKEIKKDLFNVKEIISGLTKELKLFARKDSLKVLEKYINLWNPMNFVTEKDVVNLIKHGDEVVSKEEFLSEVNKHKKEVVAMLKNEFTERILTKKDVIDLIKKEGGKNRK